MLVASFRDTVRQRYLNQSQEKSQVAHEAKEAIHIRKLDPELNKNAGKMVISRVFDPTRGVKSKNPRIASILSQELGSQSIGIDFTQFHSFTLSFHSFHYQISMILFSGVKKTLWYTPLAEVL